MNPDNYTIIRFDDVHYKIILTVANRGETVSRAFAWAVRQQIQNVLIYCPTHGDRMLEYGVEDQYWCTECYAHFLGGNSD